MMKVAVVVWLVLGPTLAGALLLTVLMIPSLQLTGDETSKWVLYSVVAGFVVALPISWVIASKISATLRR